MSRPKVNSDSQKELDKIEKDFEKFDGEMSSLTLDRMNEAPKSEEEPQTKLGQKDIEKMPGIYLKPIKRISSKEKFNEEYRSKYDYAKEYVHFTAENKEIIGEMIDLWTKPFAGMDAEEWKVPVNKPIWGPRYLAEQIKRKKYHRLVMNENTEVEHSHMGTIKGQMVVDKTVQRLDAHPVSTNKSIFMGASS